MEQKRKITIFILTILVLIIFAYVLKQGKKPVPTPGITSTWETFEFNGKEFPYPPGWAFENTKSNERDFENVAVYKENGEKDQIVYVGSDKPCEELGYRLCLGKNPVYTNSQNPEAMQLFNMYVRINENPQNKK